MTKFMTREVAESFIGKKWGELTSEQKSMLTDDYGVSDWSASEALHRISKNYDTIIDFTNTPLSISAKVIVGECDDEILISDEDEIYCASDIDEIYEEINN